MAGSSEGFAKGLTFGAISGFAAYGVGHVMFGEKLTHIQKIQKAISHGISQGAISAMQHGEGAFRSGFWGAAAGSYFPADKFAKTMEGKIFAAAMVGGTASILGGGKFANGAMSAAMVMMFNHLSSPPLRVEAVRSEGSDGTELDVTIYSGKDVIYEGKWFNGRKNSAGDPFGENGQLAEGAYEITWRTCANCKYVNNPAISNTGNQGEVSAPFSTKLRQGIVMHKGSNYRHSQGCLVSPDMYTTVIPMFEHWSGYGRGESIPLTIKYRD